MIRNTAVMLAYEAKRRPILAGLIDNIGSISVQDIDAAALPMKWMREALVALKDRHDKTARLGMLTSANTDFIQDGRMPDPMGEMRQWIAGTTYVKLHRGSSIEVKTDDLVWLACRGGIWIETIYSTMIDPVVMARTQSKGMVAKSAYMIAYKAKLAYLTIDAPMLMQTSSSPLAQYGVRFSR